MQLTSTHLHSGRNDERYRRDNFNKISEGDDDLRKYFHQRQSTNNLQAFIS